MPYIPKHNRQAFDNSVSEIIENLTLFSTKPVSSGEINYVISSIIWRVFDQHPSYTRANDLVGVLECAKQEFIRRRLNGYEDNKILENGDL